MIPGVTGLIGLIQIPRQASMAPALAVPAADLTSAQAHIDVYYADPGIIENVAPPPIINIVATDYQSLGTSATIPAGEDSVVITNIPLSQSGAVYRSLVIVSLQSSNTYTLASPSVAVGSIYDVSAPVPVAVGTP